MSKRGEYRRQHLSRAIALGLLISAVSMGSAWQAEAVPILGDIVTVGTNVMGVSEDLGNTNTVEATGYLSVTATGGYGIGIFAEGGTTTNPSTTNVGLGEYISVKATGAGGRAEGLGAYNNGVNNVTINGALTVEATGANSSAEGVSAESGGSSKLTGVNGIVVTGAATATGVTVSSGAATIGKQDYSDDFGMTVRVGTVDGGQYTAGKGNAIGIIVSGVLATDSTPAIAGNAIITGMHDMLVETGEGTAIGVSTGNNGHTNINADSTTAMGSLTVTAATGKAQGIATSVASTTSIGGLTGIKVNLTNVDPNSLSDAAGVLTSGDGSLEQRSNTELLMVGDNADIVVSVAGDNAGGNASTTGISANKYSTNTITGVHNISVTNITDPTGQSSQNVGVVASNNGKNNINAGATTAMGSLSVSSNNGVSFGICAEDSGSNNYGGLTGINVKGSISSTGITASNGSAANNITMVNKNVSDTADLTVTATAGSAMGMQALGTAGDNASKNTLSGVHNITVSATNTNDASATGIYASYGVNSVNEGSTEAMGALTVAATGDGSTAEAIVAREGTNKVGGLTAITVTARENASGLIAQGVDAKASNVVQMVRGDNANGPDLTVTAETSFATGVRAVGDSTVSLTGVNDIVVTGAGEVTGIFTTADSTTTVAMQDYGDDKASLTVRAGTVDAGTYTPGIGNAVGIASAYSTEAGKFSTTIVTGLHDILVETGEGSATGIQTCAGGKTEVNVGSDATGSLTVKTGNGTAKGITTTEGSAADKLTVATVNGLTGITVTGTTDARGIEANKYATNTITMSGDAADISVTATNGTATAILAEGAGYKKNTITGARDIKVQGTTNVIGIVSGGNAVNEVTATGALEATSTAGIVGGVFAMGATETERATNTVTLGGDLTVKLDGEGMLAAGITAGGYADNIINGVKNIVVTAGTDETTGGVATGIDAADNSTNIVNANGTLTVKSAGDTATGIVANKGTNTVGGLTAITVTGKQRATGVSALNGGVNDVTVTGDITTEATGNNGIAYSVAASNGGETTVKISGGISAKASGDAGVAVAVSANGGTTNVIGTGTEASELSASGATMSALLGVEKNGIINITNVKGVVESGTATDYAIGALYSGGTVNLIDSALTGNTVYSAANAVAGETNELNINLDEDSYLKGAVNVISDDDGTKNAKINLANNSWWSVTGNSDMRGTLTNSDTSIMVFDRGTDKHLSQVSVEKLVSNGALYFMNVDLGQNKSDSIVASDTVSGSGGRIVLRNLGDESMGYQARLDGNLISAVNGFGTDTVFTVINNGNNIYVNGAWTYELAKEADGSGYYLKTTGTSNAAKTAIGNVITPDIWYAENDALYGQMDNFAAGRKDKDVWVRMTHDKFSNSGIGSQGQFAGAQDIDTTFNGVALGIDKQLRADKQGNLWVGLLGGYGKGSNSYSGGNTDLKSYHVGLYSVYKATGGWYLSGILKYNRYNAEGRTSQYTVGSTDYYNGDYNQNGYGLSLLAGKKIERSNGWFVEPQVELSYHKMQSASYSLGDMPVDVDGLISKRARAGVGIGRTKLYANGNQLTLGLSASIVYEFDGAGHVTLYNNSGNTFENDYGGTWGQYRVNVGFKQHHGVNLNLGLGYNKGGHRSSPLNYSLNAMWSF
jgi:outer membrane autotransporter protein